MNYSKRGSDCLECSLSGIGKVRLPLSAAAGSVMRFARCNRARSGGPLINTKKQAERAIGANRVRRAEPLDHRRSLDQFVGRRYRVRSADRAWPVMMALVSVRGGSGSGLLGVASERNLSAVGPRGSCCSFMGAADFPSIALVQERDHVCRYLD